MGQAVGPRGERRASRRSHVASPANGQGAAASPREVLTETLTVNRLGVTGTLFKDLMASAAERSLAIFGP